MSIPSPTLFRWISPALLAIAILGCGNSDSENTGPTGSFLVTAPASIKVEAGSSGTVKIDITRSGGFTNAVILTLEDHPTELTHDTTAAAGSTSTIVLAFTVAATVAPGTYAIKACGAASGLPTQCTTISLTVTSPPVGVASLVLTPASLMIEAGETGTVAISITRESPYGGPVRLDIATFSSHPGVTFSFEPAVIPTGTTSATLTITVAADAPAMIYTGWDALWIAALSGEQRRDARLFLTVSSPAGGIALDQPFGGLTVMQGQTGSTAVAITRIPHFEGPVALSLEGTPAGVTGSFVPAVIPVGATTATLTVTVGGAVAEGFHTLTVRASGDGVADRTLVLLLRVTAASAMAMTLEPATLSIGAGQEAVVAITLARAAWFDEPVSLDIACWCDTPGVTFTFDPAVIPAGGSGATATITVAADAQPWVYSGEDQLWIVAISPSGYRYDALFYLTVTAP